jgi:uncharacterized protein (DUF302 family)
MTEPTEPTDPVDETNDESFPASDPPEWTGTHAGPPDGGRAMSAPADRPDMKTVPVALSVDEAVSRIEAALGAAAVKVFARIDQAAEAKAVGLSMLPAVVLVFGNPKGGTALMVARPTVAIDLPMKALVWQDAQGKVWLTYNTPALLIDRHGLDPAIANRLAPLGDLLQKAVRT